MGGGRDRCYSSLRTAWAAAPQTLARLRIRQGRAPTRGPATMRDLDLEPRTATSQPQSRDLHHARHPLPRAHRKTQERTDR